MKRLLILCVSVLLLSAPVFAQQQFTTSKAIAYCDNAMTVCSDRPFELFAQATAITIRVIVDGVNTDLVLSAKEVAAMNRQLAAVNAQRVANGQNAITMGVFLRALIKDKGTQPEVDQVDAHEQAEACQAYKGLSTANQNAIKAALGDKSPCR
jgi:hypothetical protein